MDVHKEEVQSIRDELNNVIGEYEKRTSGSVGKGDWGINKWGEVYQFIITPGKFDESSEPIRFNWFHLKGTYEVSAGDEKKETKSREEAVECFRDFLEKS